MFLLAKIDINESVMMIVTTISKILLKTYLNLNKLNFILWKALFSLKISFYLLNKFLFIRKLVLNQMTKSLIYSKIK